MLDKIKPFLKEDADTEELTSILTELTTINPEKLEQSYLNNDVNVRSWADKKVGRAIETFKTQTMGSLIEEQVKTRLKSAKDETAAETQLRLINERLDKAESDRKREQHINTALKYASERGIPTKYVEKFLGSDIEETKRYLDDFTTDFNITVNEEVDDRFKEHGRNVNYKQKNQPEKMTFTREEIAKMSKEDLEKNWDKITKQKK